MQNNIQCLIIQGNVNGLIVTERKIEYSIVIVLLSLKNGLILEKTFSCFNYTYIINI